MNMFLMDLLAFIMYFVIPVVLIFGLVLTIDFAAELYKMTK